MFDLKDPAQLQDQDLEKPNQRSVSKKTMIPNSPYHPLNFLLIFVDQFTTGPRVITLKQMT